jgi:hypothetical protein
MDISQFTGDQTPAYCSDIMAAGQGEITSCGYFLGGPVFVVKGVGVYAETSTYVSSGNVQSGYITFGIPDQKVLMAYSIDTTEPLDGAIAAAVSADDGTPLSLGMTTQDPVPIFSVPQLRGEVYETTLTILSGNGNTTSPTVRRATLQALPTITAGTQLIAALRFFREIEIDGAQRRYMNVQQELAFLDQLRSTQQVITYQEGTVEYTCTVIDIDMVYYERDEAPDGSFNGVCVVTMQTLGGLIH